MLKLTILQQMLVVSIALSTITCALVQKTKRCLKCSSCLCLYSFAINLVLGVLFCITFTSITFPESLWVGFFSFIGADTIYKSLEGKLKSYRDLTNSENVTVSKENVIERSKK